MTPRDGPDDDGLSRPCQRSRRPARPPPAGRRTFGLAALRAPHYSAMQQPRITDARKPTYTDRDA